MKKLFYFMLLCMIVFVSCGSHSTPDVPVVVADTVSTVADSVVDTVAVIIDSIQ